MNQAVGEGVSDGVADKDADSSSKAGDDGGGPCTADYSFGQYGQYDGDAEFAKNDVVGRVEEPERRNQGQAFLS